MNLSFMSEKTFSLLGISVAFRAGWLGGAVTSEASMADRRAAFIFAPGEREGTDPGRPIITGPEGLPQVCPTPPPESAEGLDLLLREV